VKNKCQFKKHTTFAANQISWKIRHIVQLSKIRLLQNQEVFQQFNTVTQSWTGGHQHN